MQLSHGFSLSKNSLFVLEGVTMNLKKGSLKEMLLFIKNNSSVGNKVAFDYFYDSVNKITSSSFGAKELSDTASKFGKKFSFCVEEGRIGEFLKENGVLLMQHYTTIEFEEKYLKMNDSNTLRKNMASQGTLLLK